MVRALSDAEITDVPALRMHLRYASPSVGPVVDVLALRRADLILRRTTYHNITVDERLLTRSFDFVPAPSRRVALLMLGGTIEIGGGGDVIRIAEGEAALISAQLMPQTRWERSTTLELEWALPPAPAGERATKLRSPEPELLRRLADALADPRAPQRQTLGLALAVFRSIGAPIDPSLDALAGEPSARDRRIAGAMEEQVSHLASRATTSFLGEAAGLSPRQLQRVVQDFNRRYGINAKNWRDTRNRWRLQIAAVLLGVPSMTVARIAEEVGFGSPNALARAFATAGFQAPATFRRLMSDKDQL